MARNDEFHFSTKIDKKELYRLRDESKKVIAEIKQQFKNIDMKIKVDAQEMKNTTKKATAEAKQHLHKAGEEGGKGFWYTFQEAIRAAQGGFWSAWGGEIQNKVQEVFQKSIGEGFKAFVELDKGIREVTTLLDDEQIAKAGGLEGLKEQADELTIKFGQDIPKATKAMYQSISSGVDISSLQGVTDIAGKLSVGGVTGIDVAIDGLTNLANSYKIAYSDTQKLNQVSDDLFIGMKYGKTTVDELAKNIGKVSPIASTMSMNFDELIASVSAVTVTGVKTNEAVTQIKAILNTILDPTKEAQEIMSELGISFGTTALQGTTLQKYLADMEGKLKDAGLGFQDVFGSVRGLSGVLSLSGPTAEKFNEILTVMGESAKETGKVTEEAFKKMEESYDMKMKRIEKQFESAFVKAFEQLSPSIAKLLTTIENLIPAISTILKLIANFLSSPFFKVVTDVVSAIAEGISSLIDPVGFAKKKFDELNGSLQKTTAELTALKDITFTIALVQNAEELKKELEKIASTSPEVARTLRAIADGSDSLEEKVRRMNLVLKDAREELTQLSEKDKEGMLKTFSTSTEKVIDDLKKANDEIAMYEMESKKTKIWNFDEEGMKRYTDSMKKKLDEAKAKARELKETFKNMIDEKGMRELFSPEDIQKMMNQIQLSTQKGSVDWWGMTGFSNEKAELTRKLWEDVIGKSTEQVTIQKEMIAIQETINKLKQKDATITDEEKVKLEGQVNILDKLVGGIAKTTGIKLFGDISTELTNIQNTINIMSQNADGKWVIDNEKVKERIKLLEKDLVDTQKQIEDTLKISPTADISEFEKTKNIIETKLNDMKKLAKVEVEIDVKGQNATESGYNRLLSYISLAWKQANISITEDTVDNYEMAFSEIEVSYKMILKKIEQDTSISEEEKTKLIGQAQVERSKKTESLIKLDITRMNAEQLISDAIAKAGSSYEKQKEAVENTLKNEIALISAKKAQAEELVKSLALQKAFIQEQIKQTKILREQLFIELSRKFQGSGASASYFESTEEFKQYKQIGENLKALEDDFKDIETEYTKTKEIISELNTYQESLSKNLSETTTALSKKITEDTTSLTAYEQKLQDIATLEAELSASRSGETNARSEQVLIGLLEQEYKELYKLADTEKERWEILTKIKNLKEKDKGGTSPTEISDVEQINEEYRKRIELLELEKDKQKEILELENERDKKILLNAGLSKEKLDLYISDFKKYSAEILKLDTETFNLLLNIIENNIELNSTTEERKATLQDIDKKYDEMYLKAELNKETEEELLEIEKQRVQEKIDFIIAQEMEAGRTKEEIEQNIELNRLINQRNQIVKQLDDLKKDTSTGVDSSLKEEKDILTELLSLEEKLLELKKDGKNDTEEELEFLKRKLDIQKQILEKKLQEFAKTSFKPMGITDQFLSLPDNADDFLKTIAKSEKSAEELAKSYGLSVEQMTELLNIAIEYKNISDAINNSQIGKNTALEEALTKLRDLSLDAGKTLAQAFEDGTLSVEKLIQALDQLARSTFEAIGEAIATTIGQGAGGPIGGAIASIIYSIGKGLFEMLTTTYEESALAQTIQGEIDQLDNILAIQQEINNFIDTRNKYLELAQKLYDENLDSLAEQIAYHKQTLELLKKQYGITVNITGSTNLEQTQKELDAIKKRISLEEKERNEKIATLDSEITKWEKALRELQNIEWGAGLFGSDQSDDKWVARWRKLLEKAGMDVKWSIYEGRWTSKQEFTAFINDQIEKRKKELEVLQGESEELEKILELEQLIRDLTKKEIEERWEIEKIKAELRGDEQGVIQAQINAINEQLARADELKLTELERLQLQLEQKNLNEELKDLYESQNEELDKQNILFDKNIRQLMRQVIEAKKLGDVARESKLLFATALQLQQQGLSDEEINKLLGTNFTLTPQEVSTLSTQNTPILTTESEMESTTQALSNELLTTSQYTNDLISQEMELLTAQNNILKESLSILLNIATLTKEGKNITITIKDDSSTQTASDVNRFLKEINRMVRK